MRILLGCVAQRKKRRLNQTQHRMSMLRNQLWSIPKNRPPMMVTYEMEIIMSFRSAADNCDRHRAWIDDAFKAEAVKSAIAKAEAPTRYKSHRPHPQQIMHHLKYHPVPNLLVFVCVCFTEIAATKQFGAWMTIRRFSLIDQEQFALLMIHSMCDFQSAHAVVIKFSFWLSLVLYWISSWKWGQTCHPKQKKKQKLVEFKE